MYLAPGITVRVEAVKTPDGALLRPSIAHPPGVPVDPDSIAAVTEFASTLASNWNRIMHSLNGNSEEKISTVLPLLLDGDMEEPIPVPDIQITSPPEPAVQAARTQLVLDRQEAFKALRLFLLTPGPKPFPKQFFRHVYHIVPPRNFLEDPAVRLLYTEYFRFAAAEHKEDWSDCSGSITMDHDFVACHYFFMKTYLQIFRRADSAFYATAMDLLEGKICFHYGDRFDEEIANLWFGIGRGTDFSNLGPAAELHTASWYTYITTKINPLNWFSRSVGTPLRSYVESVGTGFGRKASIAAVDHAKTTVQSIMDPIRHTLKQAKETSGTVFTYMSIFAVIASFAYLFNRLFLRLYHRKNKKSQDEALHGPVPPPDAAGALSVILGMVGIILGSNIILSGMTGMGKILGPTNMMLNAFRGLLALKGKPQNLKGYLPPPHISSEECLVSDEVNEELKTTPIVKDLPRSTILLFVVLVTAAVIAFIWYIYQRKGIKADYVSQLEAKGKNKRGGRGHIKTRGTRPSHTRFLPRNYYYDKDDQKHNLMNKTIATILSEMHDHPPRTDPDGYSPVLAAWRSLRFDDDFVPYGQGPRNRAFAYPDADGEYPPVHDDRDFGDDNSDVDGSSQFYLDDDDYESAIFLDRKRDPYPVIQKTADTPERIHPLHLTRPSEVPVSSPTVVPLPVVPVAPKLESALVTPHGGARDMLPPNTHDGTFYMAYTLSITVTRSPQTVSRGNAVLLVNGMITAFHLIQGANPGGITGIRLSDLVLKQNNIIRFSDEYIVLAPDVVYVPFADSSYQQTCMSFNKRTCAFVENGSVEPGLIVGVNSYKGSIGTGTLMDVNDEQIKYYMATRCGVSGGPVWGSFGSGETEHVKMIGVHLASADASDPNGNKGCPVSVEWVNKIQKFYSDFQRRLRRGRSGSTESQDDSTSGSQEPPTSAPPPSLTSSAKRRRRRGAPGARYAPKSLTTPGESTT
jgi:hypothetical protein